MKYPITKVFLLSWEFLVPLRVLQANKWKWGAILLRHTTTLVYMTFARTVAFYLPLMNKIIY